MYRLHFVTRSTLDKVRTLCYNALVTTHKGIDMEDRTYRILDHLASVLSLTRRGDENPQDNEFWSNIEAELWSAYWYKENSQYDYGTSEYKINTVARLLENIDGEKIRRLKPLPQRAYDMIREVLKHEGFLKQEF